MPRLVSIAIFSMQRGRMLFVISAPGPYAVADSQRLTASAAFLRVAFACESRPLLDSADAAVIEGGDVYPVEFAHRLPPPP
jgi:hypothetical protein